MLAEVAFQDVDNKLKKKKKKKRKKEKKKTIKTYLVLFNFPLDTS